jgi:proteasome assembly chaperone (PAC2) family protein
MTVDWGDVPVLERPIHVLAFEGWFDACESATGAVRWLADRYVAVRVAGIDPDPYFDFTERRPSVRTDDEGHRVIDWPENEVMAATDTAQPHDLLLMAGVEPHLRWRSFADDVVDIAKKTESEMVVTLGSMVDVVPHTRPLSVKGSSTTKALASRLGLGRPSYEGPTGLVGVLHDTLDKVQLPVISLRVGVPHYVAGAPNPKGTMSLLELFERVTGIETGYVDLATAVEEWEQQVSEAVANDEEAADYVRRVESETDQRLAENLPSGDDLAAEFERFLRERRDE